MKIQQFSTQTGLSAKTIRYYESIGILASPQRAANGYREYDEQDVERARFVAGARSLELSLDEITEILAMRDRREAPCRTMLNLIKQKADQIEQRIRLLKRMKDDLRQLHELGLTFSTDDIDGKNCICHLVSEHANALTSQTQKEQLLND
jgi:DNA-binding transcriptional MerR regulator